MTSVETDGQCNAPWLNRQDWVSGQIKQLDSRELRMHWFIAIIVNIVFCGLSMYAYDEVIVKGNMILISAFVPSVVSFGYLLWVLWITVRGQRHEPATLTLETIPGVIGGELIASIQTTVSLHKAIEVRLLLSCINRTTVAGPTSSGRHRGSQIVHQSIYMDEWLLPLDALHHQGHASIVPVQAGIPVHSKESDLNNRDDTIYWTVKLVARFPRGKYSASFEVPVFKTKDSDPHFKPSERESTQAIATRVYESIPTYEGVTVTPMEEGGFRFYFGPVRMKFGASMWSAFTLVVCIISIVLIKKDVHMAWQISIGLLALFAVYTALFFWLFISVVRITSGNVHLRKGILGIGLPKVYPCKDIAKVTKEQKGERGEILYNLILKLKSGKKITVAQFLSDEIHTQWLVKKMREVITSEKY